MRRLQALYIERLQDIYNAEIQVRNALEKMVASSRAPELRRVFQQQLPVTRKQQQRLERIFEELDANPFRKRCSGIARMIAEGERRLLNGAATALQDAVLAATARKLQHYEIAAYATAGIFAKKLGREEDSHLLRQTLREEEKAAAELEKMVAQLIVPGS